MNGINLNSLRYIFIFKLMKYITPDLYSKFQLKGLISNFVSIGVKSTISQKPRPSISFMKKYFKNKMVNGVEIGVRLGKNALSILKELNINKLYLIDIWLNSQEYKYVLDVFKNDLRINIIKNNSYKTSFFHKDNSLDFIYIDGNHSYSSVYQDIKVWYPKIKTNGVIAGHDVFNCIGVLNAVKNYCQNIKQKFFIRLPDWYFIKN